MILPGMAAKKGRCAMPRCVICYSPCRVTDDGKFYACPCGCSRFRASEVQRMERLCRESEDYAAYGRFGLSDGAGLGGVAGVPADRGEIAALSFSGPR